MKNFFLNVLATLAGAAILANVAFLWNVNTRLTRIETRLGISGALSSEVPLIVQARTNSIAP